MDGSPIGLIGAGLLGSALAERMLANGCSLKSFDVSLARCEWLRSIEAEVALSAAEVFRDCEIIVLCLPDSAMVRGVIAECVSALRGGQTVIDATTGDPADADHLAAELAERGIGYVAATVVGSSEQVRRGEAVVLVGAEQISAELAGPIVATWSERRFELDSPGASARLKLVVNLVLGLNRAVLAEGLALAAACGIELEKALSVLQATPAYSTVMDAKGPKMIGRDYTPQARLAQHLKDVRLIRELAARHSAVIPLSDVHERMLERACELGFAEADNAAILEAFTPEPS